MTEGWKREVYRLEQERDEAREVAKRLLKTFAAHYSAIGGDMSWSEWILAYYYPWLTADQSASEAEEEGG